MPQPLLSVVVPVYRVETFLRGCLDSILVDPTGDIEVVAVDDCSPDSCGAILDEYAARDTRVRVVHLAENVGLGRARNAGLDAATGDYVWFVDSDDELTPGAVAEVLVRLRALAPDVLLLDYLRAFPDGRLEVDPSSRLLTDPAESELTDLDRSPRLFGLMHTAWNKVVRRAFLDEIQLRFFPGWYEDYPFSHPLLMAARGIAVLPRVCYLYRQRDGGAISRTVSPRHFEAFDQYDRLHAVVDAWGTEYDRFRPQLFGMMINHLLVIAGNPGRVPPSLRPAFFHRIAEHYRRYRPAGYASPGGLSGFKHTLVRWDAYATYAVLRAGYLLVRRVPGLRRAPRTLAASAAVPYRLAGPDDGHPRPATPTGYPGPVTRAEG